jgi:hypothetical protein
VSQVSQSGHTYYGENQEMFSPGLERNYQVSQKEVSQVSQKGKSCDTCPISEPKCHSFYGRVTRVTLATLVAEGSLFLGWHVSQHVATLQREEQWNFLH